MKIPLLALVTLVALPACSDNGAEEPRVPRTQDHIWKSQTDALEKAEGVEQVISDSARKRLQEADDQGR